MRILNIIHDEKFIDNIIRYHDLTKDSASHDYIIINIRSKDKFKYIKSKERITQCRPYNFISFISKNRYDAIIIHNLISIPSKLVPKIPTGIPVFWVSWGMDIYSLPEHNPIVSLNLHHTITVNEIKRNKATTSGIIQQIKRFITCIISGESLFSERRQKDYIKAIERINYFSGVIPDEYDYLIDKPFFNAKKFTYQYLNPSSFNIKPAIPSKKKQIIIGNSSVYTNNHLDVFEILKHLNITDFDIYLPLNYGGNPEYCTKLISTGHTLWRDTFHPITSFMPLNAYNAMLDQCSHAIFYHERQQAMGNIYRLLETGCKVFLSETNLTYKFLSNFSIQSELNQKNIDSPLQHSDALNNQDIVYRLTRDKSAAIKKLTDIYETITEFNQNNAKQ